MLLINTSGVPDSGCLIDFNVFKHGQLFITLGTLMMLSNDLSGDFLKRSQDRSAYQPSLSLSYVLKNMPLWMVMVRFIPTS